MIDAQDIMAVTTAVTKDWTKQRRAEERGTRSRSARSYYSDRVNFTDVAAAILPTAYSHASGNGTYTVSKRQLYYACREAFREQTGRPLEYNYFASTLLVQYLNQNEKTTEAWKITADPRGTLTLPNCGHDERIPCGTIQIDNHLRESAQAVDELDIGGTLPTEWPSHAEGQRYRAVLYIEKEGFEPVLREARIAERFDLAILSCKGQSVVAARKYVDTVCRVNGGVPLFVIHDFDKAGFEISQRLTAVSDWAIANDRVTYAFQNHINVTDIGLRLDDVENYGLQDEAVEFVGQFATDSICTPEEQDFLRSNRRVELNAFTSPQFIEWIEAKLSEQLPGRLIPDDVVLEAAYRRAVALADMNAALAQIRDAALAKAQAVVIPADLRDALRHRTAEAGLPWDEALYEIAEEGGAA